MFHELRTYRCTPGHLRDVIRRFEKYTVPLWDKYGIVHLGFWTVLVGESNHDFIYLLRWDSMEQRQELWSAFTSDPQWAIGKAESEADGPPVASVSNQFLLPTSFSGLR